MAQYEYFIPQNIAPIGVRRIGIYNSRGNRVGQMPLGSLFPPNTAKKLYSFGAISDIHYSTHYDSDDSEIDLKRALTYFNTECDVDFICVCGDLVTDGTDDELTGYKNIVQSHSSNIPVYAVTGNHDCYKSLQSNIEKYTGKPLYYSFEYQNDVFIMLGTDGISESDFLNTTSLQWLANELEANKNKRCFLFFHILTREGSGDAYNVYWGDKLGTHENSIAFKTLLSNYHNVIWFHGHSHMRFSLQDYADNANYDNMLGCHSIHIPSITIPRESSGNNYEEGSEGYIVDVYENGIHLRGRDFAKGEFLPIASYWLDTTLQNVEAGTYVDPTKTILT